MFATVSSAGSDRRRQRILRDFDKRATLHRRALGARFDSPTRSEIVAAARSKLEQLIAEIPYAGRDRHPMAVNIIVPYMLLCFSLVLRERGATTEEIGEFILACSKPPFSWLPQWLLGPFRRFALRLTFRRMAAVAEASGRGEEPGEFVFAVPGPPPGAEFALDVRDCAVCKAFEKHGEEGVVPYICATDDLVSDAFGLGLRRTGTRALGADRCDFVYRIGGEPLRLRQQYDLAKGERLA